MITVSIVEDNQGTREGLATLLGRTERLQCLATYPSGEAALEAMPAEPPNVALVDIHLQGMNGIECVTKLKARLPRSRS